MPGDTVQNRRQWPRIVVNTKGEVIYMKNGLRGVVTLPCKIVDVSEGGALLDLGGMPVPDDILLVVDGKVKVSCQVVRRAGNNVGVRFL